MCALAVFLFKPRESICWIKSSHRRSRSGSFAKTGLLPLYHSFCRVRIVVFLLLSGLGLSQHALGQQSSTSVSGSSKNIQQSVPLGVSTGGVHAPVKDSHLRPITAGGFVDGAPVVYVDITNKA